MALHRFARTPTPKSPPAPRATSAPIPLAVGPWHASEFALLRRHLDPHNLWPTSSSVAVAIANVAAAETPPEVILLAQSRPALDDQQTVDQLLAAAPLTRIVAVAGAWCEGELRTGRPLAGALRLYWHELAPWWHDCLDLLAAGRAPHWSAPLEAPRFGDLLEDAPPARSYDGDSRTVAIDAPDYATFETLNSALKPQAWRCLWQPRHRPELRTEQNIDAAIWDGGQLNPTELASLHHFAAHHRVSRDPKFVLGSAPATPIVPQRRPPLIALVDYPRPEHLALAREAGATAVLGKPYSVATLLRALANQPSFTI